MQPPPVDERGTRLLTFLDAVVRKDVGPPGFSARLALCVEDDQRQVWWLAEFGRETTTRFCDSPPENVAVSVRLGIEEAESALTRGRFPAAPELVWLEGDRSIFQRFVERYLGAKGGVTLRAHAPR